MDYLSARRQRLWEAMESCRSGSDDLSDPQFADLAARLAEDPELRGQFQRLQQADGAIKAAFATCRSRRAGRSSFAAPGRSNADSELGCRLPRMRRRSGSTAPQTDVTRLPCPAAGTSGAVFATPAVGRFHRAFPPRPPFVPPFGSRPTGRGTRRQPPCWKRPWTSSIKIISSVGAARLRAGSAGRVSPEP